MTEEFKKLVSSLAKARNFEGGSYLLVTNQHDDEHIEIKSKGNDMINVIGIVGYIKALMQESTPEERREVLNILKKLIIREETKLLLKKETEV